MIVQPVGVSLKGFPQAYFFALRYPIKKAEKSPYPEGLIVSRFPASQSFRSEGCHAGNKNYRRRSDTFPKFKDTYYGRIAAGI